MCSCKSREQTVDHILYDCKLLEQERNSLKATVLWTENWPVSKNKLINKFHKDFKKFMNNIPFDKLYTTVVNLTNLYTEQRNFFEIM